MLSGRSFMYDWVLEHCIVLYCKGVWTAKLNKPCDWVTDICCSQHELESWLLEWRSAGTGLCSYCVRGVDGSCAKHLTCRILYGHYATNFVDDIALVLQQNRLRWYGHVLRKDDEDWVKKCMEREVEGPRPRCSRYHNYIMLSTPWVKKTRHQTLAHNFTKDQRRPGKRLYVRTVKHVSWIKRMPWTVANGERW